MSFFIHLWRLILAYTVYRRIEHERDEKTDDHFLPPASLTEVSGEVIVSEVQPIVPRREPSEVHLGDDVETPPARLPPPPASVGIIHAVTPLPPLPLPSVVDSKEEVQAATHLPPLSIDDDGWLSGDKVVKVPTKRGSYQFRTRSGKPAGCLWHWTATQHGTALAMAKRIVTGAGSSVHLWIEYDGTIYQSQRFGRGAGHAGGDTSLRVSEDRSGNIVANPASKSSVNSYLLGFEIVLVGEVRLVKKTDDGSFARVKAGTPGAVFMGWPFGVWKKKTDDDGQVIMKDGKPVMYVATGPVVKSEQVVEAVDPEGVKRCYQDYTQAQVDAAERLVRAMHAKYGWKIPAMSWGHVDVDPTRKTDPGPRWKKFWLPQILARVLGA